MIMTTDINVTGRDELIIAQALFIAAQAMRADNKPSWSNISDMEKLLERRYGGYAVAFRRSRDFALALRLGYPHPGTGSISHANVEKWIEEHQANTTNVVAFADLRSQDR
jgi:hypothetical protein